MKQRSLRLPALHQPHPRAERWQNQPYDGQRDQEIESAPGNPVERIVQWILLQRIKMPACLTAGKPLAHAAPAVSRPV